MLGEKIRELRKKRGLSGAELAMRVKCSVSTLHGIETGENANPSFRVICDISDALNISVDELKKHF